MVGTVLAIRDTGIDTKEEITRIYCEQINSSLGTMLIEFGYVPKTAHARFFDLYFSYLLIFRPIPEQGQL